MNRGQLLKRLDKAWVTFNESSAGLSDVYLMEPGVTGDWSVRDILVHVTTWEEEALKHLPLILKGGTPPRYSVRYGGIDAFNARMMQDRRSRPASVIDCGSTRTAITRSTQRQFGNGGSGGASPEPERRATADGRPAW